jgi:hypothetical protein
MTIFVSLLNVSLETRVEAIPGLLHDLFDRLSRQEIIPFKPDYCVIDIFSEVICFHYSFGLGQGQCMFPSSKGRSFDSRQEWLNWCDVHRQK